MKNEKFANSIESDTLCSAAWDDARRNAEIERAAVISSFFTWLFDRKKSKRSKSERPMPATYGNLNRRIASPVTVGGHD